MAPNTPSPGETTHSVKLHFVLLWSQITMTSLVIPLSHWPPFLPALFSAPSSNSECGIHSLLCPSRSTATLEQRLTLQPRRLGTTRVLGLVSCPFNSRTFLLEQEDLSPAAKARCFFLKCHSLLVLYRAEVVCRPQTGGLLLALPCTSGEKPRRLSTQPIVCAQETFAG